MYTDISNLVDNITVQLPTAQLLIASIPPADPSVRDPLKKDTFVYHNSQEGKDLIIDFNPRKDRFRISASGFGGDLVAGVGLKTTASQTGIFISSESPTPIGTNANFLYNTLTGLLSFDVDGVGSMTAQTIATLSGVSSLTTNNFIIAA